MLPVTLPDLVAVAPELALVVTAALLLLVRPNRSTAGLAAFTGLALALGATLPQWGGPLTAFGGAYAASPLAAYLKGLALLAGAISVAAVSLDRAVVRHHAETLALMLLMLVGALLLVSARHLALAYLAFELLSVPAYALVGSLAGSSSSTEGGIKYAIFGGAASGFLLYGFSLLYGLTGSLHYAGIADALAAGPATVIALVFVFAGVMYKLAAAPFHYWCPDAFEAAPVSVAGFLSIAPKVAGFGLLLALAKLLAGAGPWVSLLAAAALLSMTYGNLAALAQTNVKRLLAYSSIAHAGYLLVAAAAVSSHGNFAILYYLTVYLAMNLGAFFVTGLVAPAATIGEFKGLAKRAPLAAFAMAVFLFSLTGLPPFGGFIGKLFIIAAALQCDLRLLVAALVVNSVISLYYYARILRTMYFDRDAEEAPLAVGPLARFTLVLLVALVLLLGLAWAPLGWLIQWAVRMG